MTGQTRSGRARPTRASAQAGARFGRTPSRSGAGRFARSTATPRRSTPSVALRRRQPQPTGVKKLAAAAGKAVPSSGKGKAGSAALVAAAAAAAGVALKNRDKIIGQVKQRAGGGETLPAAPAVDAAPPATPIS